MNITQVAKCKTGRRYLSSEEASNEQLSFSKYKPTWADISHQRAFFEDLKTKLFIERKEDWYKIKTSDLVKHGAGGILTHFYGNSLIRALQTIYPENDWEVWNFDTVQKGYWNDPQHQRQFLQSLCGKLGIASEEDWYKTTTKQLLDFGASGLLDKFSGSLYKLLCSAFPEINWLPWRFKQTPRGFWSDIANQRKFFDWVGNKLNVKELDDWYSVKTSDVEVNGGSGLLYIYGKSLSKALSTIYPEHDWKPWRFIQVHRGFWDDESNINKFLKYYSDRYLSRYPDSWMNVLDKHFKSHKGGALMKRKGNLANILSTYYPNNQFNLYNLPLSPSKVQIYLFTLIKDMFPDHEVILDYRSEMLFQSKKKMELDIYVPSLKLAFEYQGTQHYSMHWLYGSPADVMSRDIEKSRACKEAGITLIEIPYWWDERVESLRATIHNIRPDLIQKGSGEPIPDVRPAKIYRGWKRMTIPSLVIPQALTTLNNIKEGGWWILRNVDGVRAYWNGNGKFALSNGLEIHAPDWFIQVFPISIALDGTLCLNNGTQNDMFSLLAAKNEGDERWKQVTFIITDLPGHHHLKFEERKQLIQSIINEKNVPHLEIIHATKYQSSEDHSYGLLLRREQSYYFDKDSLMIWKEKMEENMMVIDVQENHLICRLPNMSNITVVIPEGTISIPSKGAIISAIQSDGNNYSYLQTRLDLQWENIISENDIPYIVTYRNRGGSIPVCPGCKSRITRDKLRVETTVWFEQLGAGPYPGRISIHLDTACLKKGIRNYQEKGYTMKIFNGKLWVDKDIAKSTNLPNLSGFGEYAVY